MSDKRRRNRVQGGWGGSTNTNKKPDGRHDKQQQQPRQQFQHHQHAPQPPKAAFSYQPTEIIKDRPCDITYQKSGHYTLSNTRNGSSDIDLYYNFIEPDQCEWIFEDLKNSIPWAPGMVKIQGEDHFIPRLQAWFGDIPFSYSGLTLEPFKFSPLLDMLRDQIEQRTGLKFNSLLANLYRHEKDSVAWHADDERSLGHNPVIASLSFGDIRTFEMRQKPLEGDPRDFEMCQHVKIPLESGCLLVMKGATQVDWQHRIPKEYHDHGERINLTFRVIYGD